MVRTRGGISLLPVSALDDFLILRCLNSRRETVDNVTK